MGRWIDTRSQDFLRHGRAVTDWAKADPDRSDLRAVEVEPDGRIVRAKVYLRDSTGRRFLSKPDEPAFHIIEVGDRGWHWPVPLLEDA